MKLLSVALLLAVASAIGGCAYGGVAVAGDKAVVLRNGLFSNTAFVCKIGDNGVSSCVEGQSP